MAIIPINKSNVIASFHPRRYVIERDSGIDRFGRGRSDDWWRKSLPNWRSLNDLFDLPTENNPVLIQSLNRNHPRHTDKLKNAVEVVVPIDISSKGFWELSSLAFPLYQVHDILHHSLLVVCGSEGCQIVAVVVFIADWVVQPEILIDPDLCLSLAVEPNHMVCRLNRTELVLEFRITLQGVVKDNIGLLETELSGITKQSRNPLSKHLSMLNFPAHSHLFLRAFCSQNPDMISLHSGSELIGRDFIDDIRGIVEDELVELGFFASLVPHNIVFSLRCHFRPSFPIDLQFLVYACAPSH